jgi:hypothetical protein
VDPTHSRFHQSSFGNNHPYGVARNEANELYSLVNLLELVQNKKGGGVWTACQRSFSARENDTNHA